MPAVSAPLNPHAYGVQRFSGINLGGNIRMVAGQSHLENTCNTSTQNASINKVMWVAFDLNPSTAEWIEAGSKRGLQLQDLTVSSSDPNPAEICWRGHYIGRAIFEWDQGMIVYRATPYSTIDPVGNATYQIKQSGIDYQWKVYVNGYQALTIDNTGYNDAIAIEVGIESKDNTNLFTSGTYADLWQYLKPSNVSWANVVSAAISDQDRYIYRAINSTYDATNNRVTITHN